MKIQDTSETILSSFKHFFSGTLISRLTGLCREIAMAAAFGTLPAVAAFWMAFRFAQIFRRLFGEGALNAAFIPHFERLRAEDPVKGARFFYDLSTGVTLFLLFLTILLEGILGGTLLFTSMSPSTAEVVRLTMILLPALIFISLYALNTSLLNCERSYFLPSVAPAFLNLVWIGALAFLWKYTPSTALQSLAMILVFAFALQWAVTLPRVLRYLSSDLKQDNIPFSGREILRIMRPFTLGMIGVAATQINTALDAIFARFADPEGPAYLWYAIRIQQLPLALVGVGFMGALLPPISRAFEKNHKERYSHFINFALKKTVVLMLPLTLGMLVLGFCGINLIYGHGAFRDEAIVKTTYCLWAYGIGLLPMSATLVLAAAFYAQKNYRTPTLLSVTAVGLNIGLNTLFVFGFEMGAVSIALATTLTSSLNALFLHLSLKQGGKIPFGKVLLCSLCAAVITMGTGHILFADNTWSALLGRPLHPFSHSLLQQLLIFAVESVLFCAVLFSTAFLLRDPSLIDLLSLKKRSISLE